MKTDTHVVRTYPVSKSKRRITGQGMTEYIIIVALIALAGVVAIGLFGDTVQAQFAAMGAKLSGESGATALAEGAKAAETAKGLVAPAEDLKSYAQ